MNKKEQVLVSGWNSCSQSLINQLLLLDKYEITLLDETIGNNPIEGVELIRTNLTYNTQKTFEKIMNARNIIITADQSMSDEEADRNTIISILTVRSINKSSHYLVQILTENQMENAKRAGANEIISTTVLTSRLFTEALIGGKNEIQLIRIFL